MPEPTDADFVNIYFSRTHEALEGLQALGRYNSTKVRRLIEILNIKDLDAFIGICDVIIRKDAAYDESPR